MLIAFALGAAAQKKNQHFPFEHNQEEVKSFMDELGNYTNQVFYNDTSVVVEYYQGQLTVYYNFSTRGLCNAWGYKTKRAKEARDILTNQLEKGYYYSGANDIYYKVEPDGYKIKAIYLADLEKNLLLVTPW
jgi:hypothetical protein